MKKRFFFSLLHVSASATAAFAQLMTAPLLTTILGYREDLPAIIAALTLAGLAAGQSGVVSARRAKYILLLAAIGGVAVFIFYSQLVLLAAGFFPVRMLFIAYIAVALFCSGLLISNALYFPGAFSKNYFLHNALCFLTVLIYLFFQFRLSPALPHLFLAGFFLAIAFFSKECERVTIPRLSLHGESLMLGMISGGFSFCVLQSIQLWLYPVGIEFPVYLLGVFLALALAGLAKRKAILSLGGAPLVAVAAFVFATAALIGKRGDHFLFDPLKMIVALPGFLQIYWKAEALFILVLLTPYLVFALILPYLESKQDGGNHVFLVTAGNVLALGIFLLAIPTWDIHWKLGLLLALGLLHFYFFNRHKNIFFQPLGAALGFAVMFLFLGSGDLQGVAQGMRLRFSLWTGQQEWPVLARTPYSIADIEAFERRGMQTGYVYSFPPEFGPFYKQIGYGGYTSPINFAPDFIRAMAAKTIVQERHSKRILVIGLGNQLTLKYLQAALVGTSDFSVDVVDNFPLFADLSYTNLIGANSDFHWPAPGFRFILQDAFAFLARQAELSPYDLVITNLTWPNYAQSRKLYTGEFLNMIAAALSPSGVLLTEFVPNRSLVCLSQTVFSHVKLYPRASEISVLLHSRAALEDFSGEVAPPCESGPGPSLRRPVLIYPSVFGGVERDLSLAKAAAGGGGKASTPEDFLVRAWSGAAQSFYFSTAGGGIPMAKVLDLQRPGLDDGIILDSLGDDFLASRLFFLWSYKFRGQAEAKVIEPVLGDYSGFIRDLAHYHFGARSPFFFTLLPDRLTHAWVDFRSAHAGFPDLELDLKRYLKGADPADSAVVFSENFADAAVYLGEVRRHWPRIESFPLRARPAELSSKSLIVYLLDPLDLQSPFVQKNLSSSQKKIIFLSETAAAGLEEVPRAPNSLTYFFWLPGMSKNACEFDAGYKRRNGRSPSQRAGLFFAALNGTNRAALHPTVLVQSENSRHFFPPNQDCR